MFFNSLKVCLASAAAFLSMSSSCMGQQLRVCADPDNMPFSNIEKAGFENAVAQIIAADLKEDLVYVWQRMGRGFVREYMNQSRCDLLIGIPSNFQAVLTTKPYYRSTFTFLVRSDASLKPKSLDDPVLAKLRIGVQALDEEYTPPGEALVRRGMQQSLKAFHTVGGDADSIIQAVVKRDVDVALVWGPLAGYAVTRYGSLLETTPIAPESDGNLPFTFAISMGVKKGNEALRAAMDLALERRKSEISQVLTRYAVPQLSLTKTGAM
jgi:mxaJ protein